VVQNALCDHVGFVPSAGRPAPEAERWAMFGALLVVGVAAFLLLR
jgi:hypothetical protein